MRPDKLQVGMLLQHPVTCSNLFFVSSNARMEVHMKLRVGFVIVFVIIHRHFFQRLPAVFWFSEMPDQWNVVFLNKIQYSIESGIINKNELAIFIPQIHSHILPYFDSDGAF